MQTPKMLPRGQYPNGIPIAMYAILVILLWLVQVVSPHTLFFFAPLVELFIPSSSHPFILWCQLAVVLGLIGQLAFLPKEPNPMDLLLKWILVISALYRRMNLVILFSYYDVSLVLLCFVSMIGYQVFWSPMKNRAVSMLYQCQKYLTMFLPGTKSDFVVFVIGALIRSLHHTTLAIITLSGIAQGFWRAFSFTSSHFLFPTWSGALLWYILAWPLALLPVLTLIILWSSSTQLPWLWFSVSSLVCGVYYVGYHLSAAADLPPSTAIVSACLYHFWPCLAAGMAHMYCLCTFSGNEPLSRFLWVQYPMILTAKVGQARDGISSSLFLQGLFMLLVQMWINAYVHSLGIPEQAFSSSRLYDFLSYCAGLLFVFGSLYLTCGNPPEATPPTAAVEDERKSTSEALQIES